MSPDDWTTAVMSSALSARTKNVLFCMSRYIKVERSGRLIISVPTVKVARETNGSTRTVDRAVAEAIKTRWLDSISRGQKHRTAVYQPFIPDALSPTLTCGLRPRTSVGLRNARQAQKGSQSDTSGGPVVKRNLPDGVAVRNERRQDDESEAGNVVHLPDLQRRETA